MINKDNIMLSRPSSEDIRCDRFFSIPMREIINANIMLVYTKHTDSTMKKIVTKACAVTVTLQI